MILRDRKGSRLPTLAGRSYGQKTKMCMACNTLQSARVRVGLTGHRLFRALASDLGSTFPWCRIALPSTFCIVRRVVPIHEGLLVRPSRRHLSKQQHELASTVMRGEGMERNMSMRVASHPSRQHLRSSCSKQVLEVTRNGLVGIQNADPALAFKEA